MWRLWCLNRHSCCCRAKPSLTNTIYSLFDPISARITSHLTFSAGTARHVYSRSPARQLHALGRPFAQSTAIIRQQLRCSAPKSLFLLLLSSSSCQSDKPFVFFFLLLLLLFPLSGRPHLIAHFLVSSCPDSLFIPLLRRRRTKCSPRLASRQSNCESFLEHFLPSENTLFTFPLRFYSILFDSFSFSFVSFGICSSRQKLSAFSSFCQRFEPAFPSRSIQLTHYPTHNYFCLLGFH